MRGSIKKHAGMRGTSWYAVIDLSPDPTSGKRRQKRVSAPTKRECEEKVRQLLNQADNMQIVGADNLTFSEYADRWLESVESNLRPSTFRRYRGALRLHAVPIIGHLKLTKLSPIDLQRLYADRLEFGLSSTTVHHLHVILHRTLKQAMRWGMVTRNVT